MVGGVRCVVIHVKCDPNRLRGYCAVGVENGPSLLLWPVAYTTACTTVQGVILFHTPMARYSLFVLKVPLNTNKPNKQWSTYLRQGN